MKLSAYLLIGIFILAAGATGGAFAAFRISAEQIEELTTAKTVAEKDRDTAVTVSIETTQAALELIAGQKRIADIMGEIERDLQARAAAEAAIKQGIRRAPAEDNGPVPKVVRDTVEALYAGEVQAP